ncbi:phage virion morphogenesis protein [Citrobacter braakii]|uniref:phage virion morphogenesis protein n=1 Tax=Citrobacter braakii TaxID=57706 RepID=UPI003525A6A4
MSGVHIKFDAAQLQQLLGTRLKNLEYPYYIMQGVALELDAITQDAFRNHGDPVGSWPGLRPSTRRAKERRGRSIERILRDSGILATSVQINYSRTYAEISTNMVYAAIHQFGGDIHRSGVVRLRTRRNGKLYKRGNLATFAKKNHKLAVERPVSYTIHIPARPFFPITDDGDLTQSARRRLISVIDGALTQ